MNEGVLKYEVATVSIFFEDGKASCQYCPLLETYSRNQCRKTGEYLSDTRRRGNWCPLAFEEN